jgi:hypothetical protein
VAAAVLTLAATIVRAGSGPAQAAPNPSAPKKSAAAAKAKPAPVLSDAALEAAIRAKFAKSKINEDKFQARVQGGVATIEGRTESVQHKGVATRLAKSAGAKAVNNHIQISDAAKQKAAANLETGRRRAQIKRSDARSDPPAKETQR